jgi:hypothetical protein
MAKVVSTAYVDDLDGSEASGPVVFSIDGKAYEIDLSSANAERLRDALAPFISAARRGGGTSQRSSSPARQASGRSREESQEIRTVLRELGYDVKDRGRLRADLLAAYETRTPAPDQPGEVTPPADDANAEEKPKRSRKKSTGQSEDRGTARKVVEFRSA